MTKRANRPAAGAQPGGRDGTALCQSHPYYTPSCRSGQLVVRDLADLLFVAQQRAARRGGRHAALYTGLCRWIRRSG
jgi:hypothetical protein